MMAALLVGLTPFFVSQARYQRKSEAEASAAQIVAEIHASEDAINAKIDKILEQVVQNTADIEAFKAQIVDLIDRIEQLRVAVVPGATP